uniref:C3H1-type domain-containing protein n=1 Tax=Mesocestoides corti TaxID=53468 RepID=A0A5K3FDZ1_MESCO
MRVNKGALKNWLRTKIASLSISDPIPLSKYIFVLISKDKPENELKAFCIDQLEELLGDNTVSFVEEMFAVALTSPTTDLPPSEKPSVEERLYRRPQGKSTSRNRSPLSDSPERLGRPHQRSPMLDSFRSPSDAPMDSNAHRGRRQHYQNSGDSRRHHHEPHEYNPEDFNDRSVPHRRSRSDVSDAEDNEGQRERPTQRLERALPQHNERSRERGARVERLRGGKPEDSEETRHPRRRCRNFDERGFCIYGDRCKFDHGSDALVIPGNTAAAWTANLFDTALAATGSCLLPRTSPSGPNGIIDGGNDTQPTSSVEQEDIESGALPIYNPTPIVEALARKPAHLFRPRPSIVNKNIIPIPMDNSSYDPSSSSRQRHEQSLSPPTTPPAYEPARPELSDEGSGTNRGEGGATATTAEYTPSPITQQQCSLLVTKLPWRLNDLQRLRNHFGRFGSLVNIQTNFGGQNSQALVTYASAAEAEAAYRSPEPILSNRFIRLSLWPNNNTNNFASGRMGGRFRGAGYRRHGGTLGFSQFGQSLLGDAQPVSSRLPAKFRLGDASSSSPFLKRSRSGGGGGGGGGGSTTRTLPNNRSRWRLERDEDGNPVSAEDDDDEDNLDDDLDELEKKRLRSSDPDDGDSFVPNRTSWNSTSSIDENPDVAAALQRKKALWERQKATALKEHQAKLAQFEKQRAARQQAEADRQMQLAQLSAELRETLASLKNPPNSEVERSLRDKAKTVYKQLVELKKAQQPPLKRSAGGVSGITDDIKQKATVQQLLPDTVATERLEKMAEVKRQLAELENQLQETTDSTSESHAGMRRKITELKRKLVNLETIRPSDLAAINASSGLPVRGQTKLDKRPRVLYVTGHSTYDVEDFRQALALNYLYTESFRPFTTGNDSQPVIEITFCTRDFAEAAVRMFPQFHGRKLVMSFTPPVSLTQEEPSRGARLGKSGGGGGSPIASPRPTDAGSGDALCAMDELNVPVVDATVGDEFRSPKKTVSSPQPSGTAL